MLSHLPTLFLAGLLAHLLAHPGTLLHVSVLAVGRLGAQPAARQIALVAKARLGAVFTRAAGLARIQDLVTARFNCLR